MTEKRKINRLAEMRERAEKAEAIPDKDRTLADGYAISALKCLQEAISEQPHLEWTFNLAPGTQLYVTKDCSDPERDWGPNKGDILILNQCTAFKDRLGCQNADGLGTTVERNRVRLAKPSDVGFKATKLEWYAMGYGRKDPGDVPAGWILFGIIVGALLGYFWRSNLWV